MKRNKRKKNTRKQKKDKRERKGKFSLPHGLKKGIGGIAAFLIAIIFVLSFFELAGPAGRYLKTGFLFLIGKTIFIIPLVFLLWGLIFFTSQYKRIFYPLLLAFLFIVLAISGTLENFNPGQNAGGILGYLFIWPILKIFDFWVTQIILVALMSVGFLIFGYFLYPLFVSKKEPVLSEESFSLEGEIEKPSLVKKIFAPKFKVKEVQPSPPPAEKPREKAHLELEKKPLSQEPEFFSYQSPPLDLLEKGKSSPLAGDTSVNAAIIKKTLQNFDIPVEISEINIGPTVTQYALKPAEGIKLSKITALTNDLALALASHPIRIEAPIPGKPLVGVEVPNKVRAKVLFRELIEKDLFQKASSPLTIVLGKDVSGAPFYADLTRMPHLLVAGATGTGKTIFLNTLLLSLLYRNSPQMLRFILIDPKRVEFAVYNELPHLLCPVIYDAGRSVNALKWLISEMERRFEVLSETKSRDIASHNRKAKNLGQTLPYIVLVIDELADLMAAKGRELEAGIVRLAQMARAVGIHLVVATQRPSVEVITGLIKANITSRVTFQVASQVDSRTILDVAGAERLLGRGDMLYLSAEIGKPKRVQAPFVSEKEVKRVVSWIQSRVQAPEYSEKEYELENALSQEPDQDSESAFFNGGGFSGQEDPLYEEAKRVVLEAKKASASLLQRRLRIGYARAARLIDMLEEKGVVGPGEGAKPREVYYQREDGEKAEEPGPENGDWQKV